MCLQTRFKPNRLAPKGAMKLNDTVSQSFLNCRKFFFSMLMLLGWEPDSLVFP